MSDAQSRASYTLTLECGADRCLGIFPPILPPSFLITNSVCLFSASSRARLTASVLPYAALLQLGACVPSPVASVCDCACIPCHRL